MLVHFLYIFAQSGYRHSTNWRSCWRHIRTTLMAMPTK